MKLKLFHAAARILESRYAGTFLRTVARLTRPKTQTDYSRILVLCVDLATWRFTPLVSVLESEGFDVSVAVVSFGHRKLVDRNVIARSLRNRGHNVWIPRLFRLSDWTLAHSFGTVITNHPYLVLGAPFSYRSLDASGARLYYSPYSFGVVGLPAHHSKHSRLKNLANVRWLWETDYHKELSRQQRPDMAQLGIVAGFPSASVDSSTKRDIGQVRVGFAPHWSSAISKDRLDELQLETIYEVMRYLAERYPVVLELRPHPRFYEHFSQNSSTDQSRAFMALKELATTEPESSDSSEFLLRSEILIHNSGSFMAEYALLGKPSLWLGNRGLESDLNLFGKEMLARHQNFSPERLETLIIEQVAKLNSQDMPNAASHHKDAALGQGEATFEIAVSTFLRAQHEIL